MTQKDKTTIIRQTPNYFRVITGLSLFLIVLSSCGKSNKEPTNLEKFLTSYTLAYPEGYKFENGYYNFLSYTRSHSDKSTIFSAENYNISGEFSLRYETTPFYQFSLNNMKLKRFSTFNAGSTIPYEQHEDILWDGENLYNKYRYNTHALNEVWTQKTSGTDQVDTVFIESRIPNVNGVITNVKSLLGMENKNYLFVKQADFLNNTLTIYYSSLLLNKIVTINFDNDMKLTRYETNNIFIPNYPEYDNTVTTQILVPISKFNIAVPTDYEEDYIVESNVLEFDL